MLVVLAPLFLASTFATPAPVQDPGALLEPVEIRALLVRPSDVDVLGDPAALGAAMQRTSELGFDALVLVASEGGRTLRPSPTLAAAGFPDASAFPGRDVLTEVVFQAHRFGLEVLVEVDGAWSPPPAPVASDKDKSAPDKNTPAKLPLAPGSKDRLDPRDAAVRALARAYLKELVEAAEIDGLVLANGLAAFTVEEARDPAAKKAVADASAELAAWRETLRAFDKSLVVGWAALDPRFAGPTDAKGLDFALISRATKDVPAWAAGLPGRVARTVALDATTTPESFAADLAASREKPFAGEVVGPFSALVGREDVLTAVLDQGIDAPYYARATLPWRGGVAWRPTVELVELVNDSGTFEKVEEELPYANLPAEVHGDASWAMRPIETGPHELWVYLPPSADELPPLEFTVTTDPRRARRVTLPAHVPRGWTRVAQALLANPGKSDVLRLSVPGERARPIAIGAMVAIPRRRLDGR